MSNAPSSAPRSRPPVPRTLQFDAAIELALHLASLCCANDLDAAIVVDRDGEIVASVGDAPLARALAHEATEATDRRAVGDAVVLHGGRTYAEVVEIDGARFDPARGTPLDRRTFVVVVHAARSLRAPSHIVQSIRDVLPEPSPVRTTPFADELDFFASVFA